MLPEKYTDRMKEILGDEFIAYINELENKRVSALRVNKIKCSNTETFISKLPFECEKIPYCADGYYFSYDKPGISPFHHAGAFYIQEPSAMAPVAALGNILPEGIKILDACASPGGKTSQAVSLSPEKNIVVSNEIIPSRCKTLVGNIERLGFRNSVVLNADTKYLSENFREEFGLVICDAPCSGEGMFRKNPEAVKEWSAENVLLCAARQKEILNNLSHCVCEGGYLLYSTCTFSPEENEMNVSYFLENNPDYELLAPDCSLLNVTDPGISKYCANFDSGLVRRFYPHTGRGEGQFFALFKKKGTLHQSIEFSYRDGSRELNREERSTVSKFLYETVGKVYGNIRAYGDNIIVLPDGLKAPLKKVFACGVKIGEIRSGRVVPHHQFFSAYGKDFLNKVCISQNSRECFMYLRGEGFEYGGAHEGWAAVMVDDIALGGAKIVGGYLKNHYPKGLRIM